MKLRPVVQTSFAAGVLNRELSHRFDFKPLSGALLSAQGALITPLGSITRAPGSQGWASAPDTERLIGFDFEPGVSFVLSFAEDLITIYSGSTAGLVLDTVVAPWSAEDLPDLYFCQINDKLYLSHPSYAPQILTRVSDNNWTLAALTYPIDTKNGNRLACPYWKFADDAVTLNPSGTTGSVTVVASADLFVAGHVGTRFRLENKEIEITAVASATSATATCKQTLVDDNATKDWVEQAYSAVRGWPAIVGTYQGRAYLAGGGKPNFLALGRSTALFDFETSDTSSVVTDSHAIVTEILGSSYHRIRSGAEAEHGLYLLTSSGEVRITREYEGGAFGPKNYFKRVIEKIGHHYPTVPVVFGQSILYVPRGGGGVNEIYPSDTGTGGAQVRDLSQLCTDIFAGKQISRIVGTVLPGRRVYALAADGTLYSLTFNPEQSVFAWTIVYTGTTRKILDIAVTRALTERDDLWLLMERTDGRYIELLSVPYDHGDALTARNFLWSANQYTDATPKQTWAGLDQYDGTTVNVVADGYNQDLTYTVTNGTITLFRPASTIWVGYENPFTITAMPRYDQGWVGVSQRPTTLRLGLIDSVTAPLTVTVDGQPIGEVHRNYAPVTEVLEIDLVGADADLDHEVTLTVGGGLPFNLYSISYDQEVET